MPVLFPEAQFGKHPSIQAFKPPPDSEAPGGVKVPLSNGELVANRGLIQSV